MSDTDLFQEWRAADRAAHAMEQLVVRQSLQALEGKSDTPLEEDHYKARRLRETANDLFVLAMDDMKRRAGELRR